MKQLLSGATVFDGNRTLSNHSVIINHSKIEAIIEDQYIPVDIPQTKLSGGFLAPGFIDLQVNGGGGVLFNNAPSPDAVQKILNGHNSKGVTALLPTLISDNRETLQAALNAVKQAIQSGIKGIIGIHIEGPFLNLERRGVHHQNCIRPLSQSDIDWLCLQADIPIMLTLAPEQCQTGQIAQLSEAGITVCAGHTNAQAADIERALSEGLKGFTHLFNAMRQMTGREPGVVGSALADENSWCGIIVDNHHVHPNSVRVAHAAKAPGKLYLVSDSMATIGSSETSFELYGETIYEEHGRLINSEGKLAGSAIGLIDAVRISHQTVGLELEECLKMASLYPAQMMQQDHLMGRLKKGYKADLVHFTTDFEVTHTWSAGKSTKHSEGI